MHIYIAVSKKKVSYLQQQKWCFILVFEQFGNVSFPEYCVCQHSGSERVRETLLQHPTRCVFLF